MSSIEYSVIPKTLHVSKRQLKYGRAHKPNAIVAVIHVCCVNNNSAENYDAKSRKAGGKKQGILKLGQFGMEDVKAAQLAANMSRAVWLLSSLGLVIGGIVFVRRRRK